MSVGARHPIARAPDGARAWMPVPAAAALIVVLWLADVRATFAAPLLQVTVQLVVMTGVSWVVAYLAARAFLARGSPSLLMIGCGVLAFGLSGTVSTGGDIDRSVTIHKMSVALSGLLHLAGIALPVRRPVHARVPWLFGAYFLTLAAVGLIVLASIGDRTPPFFVDGEGGTPVRDVVLGVTIAMFVASAVLLRARLGIDATRAFRRWYALGLALIALGLGAVLLQPAVGSPLGWTGRVLQWAGSVYLLVAVLRAARESGVTFVPAAMPSGDARVRYGLAIAFVAAAVVLRLALLAPLGNVEPFAGFYPAVLLATVFGGLGPGLLAIAMSLVAGDLLWVEPVFELGAGTVGDVVARIVFAATAVGLVATVEWTRRTRDRAEQAERLRRASEEGARAARMDTWRVALADALRPLDDPAVVERTAARTIAEQLAVSRAAFVAIVDGEYGPDPAQPEAAGTRVRPRLEDFGPRMLDAYLRGRAYVLDDVEAEAGFTGAERAAFAAAGIGSMIGVPLLEDGGLVGALEVTDPDARRWTPEEIAWVQESAERTRTAVGQARTARALRDSERRYRAVVDTQGEMVCRFRPDGEILFANPAYAAGVGSTPEAMIGRSFWDFIPADEHPRLRALLDRLSPAEPEVRIENRFGAGERTRWTLWTNRALAFDETGHVTEAQSTGIDISERRRAEEQLRSIEARQRFLLRLEDAIRPLGDPLDIQDAAARELGRHLRAARVLYGETQGEEIVFHRCYADGVAPILGRLHADTYGRRMIAAFAAGRTHESEDTQADPSIDDTERAALRTLDIGAYLGVPLFKGATWVATLGVHDTRARAWSDDERTLVEDVAHRTWDAVERARAQAALREADVRKDEFIAMLAHELRNPLAPLTNALKLLERTEPLTGRGRDALAMSQRQTRQLQRLVDDLLEISRITRGKIELRPEPVLVGSIVHHAVESVMHALEASRHELTVELPPRPVRLLADPARVAQMLENLLVNACKYTPDGGRIRVAVEPQADGVEIRVEDNGVGIDPSKLDLLFEPFSQIDTTIDRTRGGLGIGLAMVRRLVELHGGSVRATSDGPGRGATFVLWLPAAGDAFATRAGAATDTASRPT